MKRLSFSFLIVIVLSFIIVHSCSNEEEEETIAPIVQTPEPEPPAPTQYSLTVTVGEGGTVSTEGGTYDEGTEITITATANEGYIFIGWEGNDSASESLNITLNSNQTFQALFELVVDSDGDGVADSEDYLPYNPYKTYDDWGEFKDEYADVFYSSDISELNVQGMMKDIEMAQDIYNKIGAEFWVIGNDLDAVMKLAETWCDRRVERGQLFYYEGSQQDGYTIEEIKSICMSEVMNPHASTEWANGESSVFFTGDLLNYVGTFERLRKLIPPSGAGYPPTNRDWNFSPVLLTQPFHYDELSIPDRNTTGWNGGFEDYTYLVLAEYVGSYQGFLIDSRETIVDITGNTVRPEEGPGVFTGGWRGFYHNYILRKLSNEGKYSIYGGNSPLHLTLKEHMTEIMSLAQNEFSNCPDFILEELLSSGTCTYYNIGEWASAFLINRVNNIEVFNQILWPKINEMGFIGAFEDTFNITYESLNEEFKAFLNLPLEEQLEIIPDISF